jgi:hypothetical protein
MTNKAERTCAFDDCTRPRFGRSPITKRDACSAHYQQERRALAAGKEQPATESIREYGKGYNRLSGCVNDDRFAKLKKEAEAHFGGSTYKLVQEVMSLYADGLDD